MESILKFLKDQKICPEQRVSRWFHGRMLVIFKQRIENIFDLQKSKIYRKLYRKSSQHINIHVRHYKHDKFLSSKNTK